MPNRISLFVTPRTVGVASPASRTDAMRGGSSPLRGGFAGEVATTGEDELACSGAFAPSPANRDVNEVPSVPDPRSMFDGGGKLPLMNSAAAAPINAAAVRPTKEASPRPARRAGGGSRTTTGSSERWERYG